MRVYISAHTCVLVCICPMFLCAFNFPPAMAADFITNSPLHFVTSSAFHHCFGGTFHQFGDLISHRVISSWMSWGPCFNIKIVYHLSYQYVGNSPVKGKAASRTSFLNMWLPIQIRWRLYIKLEPCILIHVPCASWCNSVIHQEGITSWLYKHWCVWTDLNTVHYASWRTPVAIWHHRITDD